MTADMPDAVKVAESFCDEKSIEDYKTRAGAILGARAMQDAMAGRVRECDLRSIDWRGLFISVLDRMRQGGESREMGARWMAEAASRAILSALEPAGAQEGAASPIAAMAATLQAVADEGVFAPDPLVQEETEECPYPINGKPLGTPASDCVAAGECGCVHGATPAPDVPGLVARLRAAYALVAMWPEREPDGFLNLLALRNLTPEAADALEALQAEVARKAGVIRAQDYDYGRACDERDEARSRATAAEAERDKLKAEVERLRIALGGAE